MILHFCRKRQYCFRFQLLLWNRLRGLAVAVPLEKPLAQVCFQLNLSKIRCNCFPNSLKMFFFLLIKWSLFLLRFIFPLKIWQLWAFFFFFVVFFQLLYQFDNFSYWLIKIRCCMFCDAKSLGLTNPLFYMHMIAPILASSPTFFIRN